MPARQPTPGPSTLDAQPDTLHSHNTKKRGVSENNLDTEQRQSKKHRKEAELENKPVSTSTNSKDSKKKRRKKKRKSPLIIPDPNHEQILIQAKLKDPTIPLSATSSTTLSEVFTPPPTTAIELVKEVASTVFATSHIHNAEKNEKLAFTSIEKGKAKALSEYPDILTSQSNESMVAPVVTDSMKESQAKIADLTAQLDAQKTLLSRHEDHLSHLQQSLTCQICLDLLYKPYALSPCGHIACYLCLVRWFTSIQNDNPNANAANANPVNGLDDVPRLLNSQPALRGTFIRNHKSCPLCRAAIIDRPAEIWSIKSMVAHLIKSKLIELPSAPPPSATETPNANEVLNSHNDPWRNIFGLPRSLGRRRQYQAQFFPPPPADHEDQGEGWGPQDMGMYDAEDGGIYRCLDCMHEIWGGVCTNCEREYAGHARFGDGDDDDGDDFSDSDVGPGFLGRRLREIWDGYARDNLDMGWLEDSEDDDEGEEEEGGDNEDDGGGDIGVYGEYLGGIDLTDVSDEGSVAGDAEEARFTPTTSEDGEDSEPSWSSDDEDDGHNALLAHQIEVIDMIHNGRSWPQFGQFQEDDGVAHIEEIEEEEDEDAEAEVFHSGTDTDPNPHPSSEEEQEEDYEDSFIDDDEEDGANGHNLRSHDRRRQDQVIDLVDSEEDDDGNIHHAIALAGRLGGGMRLRRPGANGRDDDHNTVHRQRHRVGRATRQVVREESSDDDQEEEVAIRPAGRRNPRRNGAAAFRRALFEDDEDE